MTRIGIILGSTRPNRNGEQVEADAAGHRGQPGAGGFDGVLLRPGQGVPASVGLLDGIFGLGQRAQEPVSEVDQLTPLAHDRVQARVGPAASWPGWGGHGAALPMVASALTSSTRQRTGL